MILSSFPVSGAASRVHICGVRGDASGTNGDDLGCFGDAKPHARNPVCRLNGLTPVPERISGDASDATRNPNSIYSVCVQFTHTHPICKSEIPWRHWRHQGRESSRLAYKPGFWRHQGATR
jgi:hypothetical protein